MSKSKTEDYDVMIVLPETEAKALAKLVARIDFDICNKFASPCTTYNGRCEADVMWAGLRILQRQLADANATEGK